MSTFGDIRNNFQIAMNRKQAEINEKVKYNYKREFFNSAYTDWMKSASYPGAITKFGTGEQLRADLGVEPTDNTTQMLIASGLPKDYFESFYADFFIEQELKNKVQKTGFKTPEGYLNNFNVSIPKTSKVTNSRKLNKKYSFYLSGIAAVLILLFMFSMPKKDNEKISLESLENYLLNEVDQSELLSNILTMDELNDLSMFNFSYSEIESFILQNASVETLLID